MDADKRPEFFVELVEALGVQGRVVGEGPLVEGLRASSPASVEWSGWRDPSELFADASLYLGTARREAFGRCAVEAAQAGLPIVLTDQYGAAPLLFTDPGLRARFVLPVDDKARWVEAVRALLDDAALRRQVSDHVWANAQRLTIASSVDRVLDRLAATDGTTADRRGGGPMSRLTFHDLPGRLSRRGAKVGRGVRALVRTPLLGVASRVSSRPLVDASNPTVVSLTSYAARLRSVHLTIESIGRGSVRPGRIILWVDPEVVVDELPEELQRLRRRGLEIASSPGRYGPHTKYFPYVMSEAPHDALLVTADDDSLYPRWWLASLQEAAAGSEDVVCFRAHRVGFGADGRLAPYNSWSPVAGTGPSRAQLRDRGVRGRLPAGLPERAARAGRRVRRQVRQGRRRLAALRGRPRRTTHPAAGSPAPEVPRGAVDPGDGPAPGQHGSDRERLPDRGDLLRRRHRHPPHRERRLVIDLLVLLTAILVVVLVFRQRPAVWISLGILAAVFLPVAATRAWLFSVGPLGRIHPAAWIFLIGFLVTTLFTPVRRTLPRVRTGIVVAIGLWVALTFLVVYQHSGLSSVGAFVVYYLTPPLAFLAIHAAVARTDLGLWKKLVPVVLVAAALQAVLALLQFVSHSSLLYGQYFANYYWWNDYLDRSVGTFDSPLDLAAFLTMCIPLTAALRRSPVVYALAGLLALGVVVSGSRTGVVLAAVVIVVLVFVRSSNAVPAILVSVTLALATAFLLVSPLATTLVSRFGSQGDASTGARSDALTVGLGLATNSLDGYGPGYAFTYARAYLASSFEDGYLATAIDLGLPVALGLILVQLWGTFSVRGTPLLYRVPGLLAIVWGFSYSSFVSTSAFGTLSWTFIALAAFAAYRDLPADEPSAEALPRRVTEEPRAVRPRTVLGKA